MKQSRTAQRKEYWEQWKARLNGKEAPASEEKLCDFPGCEELGEHPAPRDQSLSGGYYRFCLEHVREYNASWNFLAGMSDSEVEENVRADHGWRRPTWPMGKGKRHSFKHDDEDLVDKFGIFNKGRDFRDNGGDSAEDLDQAANFTPAERHALRLLRLTPPISAEDIKDRYKELAKKLHPDLNKDNPKAEEGLKIVNEAYATLKNSLFMRRAPKNANRSK